MEIKLFVSQPMRDKTNEEIEKERATALQVVAYNLGSAELLDSFFKDVPHDAQPLWYLGESIKLMQDADVVYFCKDWQKYKGCVIEHECAVRYGKEIFYA